MRSRNGPTGLEAMLASAREPVEETATSPMLLFEVAGSRFAVAAVRVEAIVAAAPVTPLPHPPPSVVGVASVRGRMRLVVDPGGANIASSGRLVVLHGEGQLALLADQVLGVVPEPPPDATVIDPDELVRG